MTHNPDLTLRSAPAVAFSSEPHTPEMIITALYRVFLQRDPDPSGLRDGVGMLRTGRGLEVVLAWVLKSPEFAIQHDDFLRRFVPPEVLNRTGPEPSRPAVTTTAAAAPPRIAEFTPEQRNWTEVSKLRPGDVLFVQLRPVPGSRPTLYVENRACMLQPRGPLCIDYVDALVSDYLLHPDYFHLYAARFFATARERWCAIQIADRAQNVGSIGFCADGPQVTLIPDPHFWVERGYFNLREQFRERAPPWHERRQQAFWRGSSTGIEDITVETFQTLPRYALCMAALHNIDLAAHLDAKLSDIVQTCDAIEADKIRTLAASLGILAPAVLQTEFLKYRYQIDIDGNSNSWSFLLKLLTGACVLKVASPWRQWYYEGLEPWKHYVPVSRDLSDLAAKLAWCRHNDTQAEQIAIHGLNYANEIVFGSEMPRAAERLLQSSWIAREPSLGSPPQPLAP